jgi:hypothetical protein
MSNAKVALQSGQAQAAELHGKRLLVVMPGYVAPGDGEPFADGGMLGNAFARCLASMRAAATRQHVRFYRDFYANPRSAAYMFERVQDLLGDSPAEHRVLLLGPGLEISADAGRWASELQRLPAMAGQGAVDLDALARGFDAVLLVHADALGLGLVAIERKLSAAAPGRIFVLNGRRRFYRLDPRMQRLLRRRRVLAETRVVEAALGHVIPILGGFLALVDKLSSRKAA